MGQCLQESWRAFRISSLYQEQMVRERYLLGFEKIVAGNHDKYTFIVNGAGHIDFTANTILVKCAAPYFLRPIIKRALGGPFGYGPIDGILVTEITNTYLVNFFNKYLQGKSSALLDAQEKPFKEVEVKQWKN